MVTTVKVTTKRKATFSSSPLLIYNQEKNRTVIAQEPTPHQ